MVDGPIRTGVIGTGVGTLIGECIPWRVVEADTVVETRVDCSNGKDGVVTIVRLSSVNMLEVVSKELMLAAELGSLVPSIEVLFARLQGSSLWKYLGACYNRLYCRRKWNRWFHSYRYHRHHCRVVISEYTGRRLE